MEVGVALPQYDYSVADERRLSWSTVVDYARAAERLGFVSVWLADHLFLEIDKYGAAPGEYFGYDPLPALVAIARETTSVRLGTLVVCSQLRPPALLAKALATLDVVSGGRLIVGLGAGWFEAEYRVAGVPFERAGVRLEQLTETIEVLRAMLGGGPVTFRGRHYQVTDAPCLPRALQTPHPPLWVGGRGDRLLEVVARHADGWNTVWTLTIDDYRGRVAELEAACERVGRDPADVTRSVGLYALVGEDRRDLEHRYRHLREVSPEGVLNAVDLDGWRRGHLVGTVDEVREQVAEWSDLGVHTLVACTGSVPFAVSGLDDLELLASGVR